MIMFKPKYKITMERYSNGYLYNIHKKTWVFGRWKYFEGYLPVIEESEKIIEADQFVKYVKV